MKILGKDIPDEVAAAIIAKAKTEELFREFIEDMKWQYRFLDNDKRIKRAIDFVHEYHSGCKVYFEIMYDADGSFELESSSNCIDKNGLARIGVAYDGMCNLSMNQAKLLRHLAKTYQVHVANYSPRVYAKERAFEFTFEQSPRLNDLITDIKESIPEVKVKLMKGNVIRIQMK